MWTSSYTKQSAPASSVTRATLRMLLSLISSRGRGAHAGGMRPMKIPLELICSRGWKPLKVRLDLKVYSRRFIIEFLDVGEGSPSTSCVHGSETQTKPCRNSKQIQSHTPSFQLSPCN